MKRKVLFALPVYILLASLFHGGYAQAKHAPPWARTINPIVSTDWLNDNLHQENLVILDIRTLPSTYDGGYIPGSINEPFVTGFDPCTGPTSSWIIGTDECLWLELPNEADLFITIGNLGITQDSWVVIVTDPNPDEPPFYGHANATRVALTLIYAGVANVAILDGGYTKWVEEGKETTNELSEGVPVTYSGDVDETMIASVDYVRRHLWSADIIDARDADVYFGVTIEPYALMAGHIPWAKSLPAPWIWDLNPDGTYTYKDTEILSAMASGVIRQPWGRKGHRRQKIIAYCGVGGYGSSWWFVLTQVLGYQNVKLYDGSAQEWVRYYEMVPYQWD